MWCRTTYPRLLTLRMLPRSCGRKRAASFFEVSINGSVADARLQNYIRAANLSEALLSGNDSAGGGTENKIFYALSLMEDGSPVEVRFFSSVVVRK